ncbi:uncharacterized protein LOC116581452 [Mustela erminea]|uniref:uncharacterized protein LOC116581452 n=1 Tax=Mustela erminea TaxID=36723 RepID=UPI00138749AE|nr:uncharacterized protein LOC116581452 [Mustela erminea]
MEQTRPHEKPIHGLLTPFVEALLRAARDIPGGPAGQAHSGASPTGQGVPLSQSPDGSIARSDSRGRQAELSAPEGGRAGGSRCFRGSIWKTESRRFGGFYSWEDSRSATWSSSASAITFAFCPAEPQSGQRPARRRSGGRLWYPGHYAEKCSRCGHQLPGVDRARVPTTLHPLRAARPRSVVFPASIYRMPAVHLLLCTCCRGRRQTGQAAPLPQSACLLACGGAGVGWSPLAARAVKGIRSAQRQHCRLVGFQTPGTLGRQTAVASLGRLSEMEKGMKPLQDPFAFRSYY